MYKEVLRSIDQVAIWPMISLLIFFAFFIGMVWRVYTTDKKLVTEISELPLHDGNVPTTQTKKS